MTEPASSAAGTQASGHLFVISAPSGGGKTSLVRALLERAGGLCVSTSHTTRARRDGERDGIDYHFVDEQRLAPWSPLANSSNTRRSSIITMAPPARRSPRA